MKQLQPLSYLELLAKRKARGRARTPHQLAGLALAFILDDEEHKSLYIKLAKEYDPHALMRLAKDIRDRRSVRNRGAYFMRMMQEAGKFQNPCLRPGFGRQANIKSISKSKDKKNHAHPHNQ